MTAASPSAGAALVTGAGRRLGLALAEGLAADGWDVCFHHGRSAEGAEAGAARARARGVTASAVGCDLSDPAAVET
ncbi:MAG: SDR family NAD(P)-dependent oxidoreductase, partial [Rhizobiaceae bacterium]|nr:SDR family NAD(P)-dependent oxidoreductase [Rhizobiaceae bacterium]